MAGEYPPARRRSGRRARGGRTEYAGTESDAHPGHGAYPGARASANDHGFGSTGFGQADAGQAAPRGTGALASPEDPQERARQVCLRLLTLAPRTRAQLADALSKRGIPDEVAENVLGRFTSAGLIDDAAFARAWVESRHHGRGLSGRALTAELRQRGVDDDQIREAVHGLGPDAEVEAARRLVERKLAGTQGQPPEARTRRLAGMLARKGYPPGLAFRVIREALEAEGMDADGAGILMEEPPPDDLDP